MSQFLKLLLSDTWVDSNNPNVNYFDDDTLTSGKYLGDGTGPKIYFKIDLSQLPNNARIVGAHLRVFPSYIQDEGNLRLYPVRGKFNVEQVTYNTQPDVYSDMYVGNYFDYTDENSWMSFNVKSYIESIVDGTLVDEGFMLHAIRGGEGGCKVKIESNESLKNGGEYKPSIDIIYDIPATKPTNLNPTTDINRNNINRFSWIYNPSHGGDRQTEFEIRYSYDNEQWLWRRETTANNYYDFPSQFFGTGKLYWKMRVKNSNDLWGDYTDVIEINVNEYSVNTPLNLVPIYGSVIDIGESNTFSWDYIAEFEGDIQSEYELQYSYNNTSWTTVKATTSTSSHTFGIGSLTAEGKFYYKVRVKNKFGNWSNFSSTVQTNLKRKPITPTVTTSSTVTTSRPVISWTTPSDQYAYEVEIYNGNTKVWGSNKVVSEDRSVQVGTDLANNITFTVKVRVYNKYSDVSDWASKSITTNFNLPNAPIISIIEAEGKSILINITNPIGGETVVRNDIYRSVAGQDQFILVGSVIAGEYKDYSPKNGEWYEYKVRAIGQTGGFNDSDTEDIKVEFKNTFISNSNLYIELKLNPSRDISYGAEKSYFNFVGRQHKVAEFGELEETNINCSFLATKEQLENLKQLHYSKENLNYRDGRGRALKVSMDSLSAKDYPRKMELFEISMSFSEVD